MRRRVPRSVKRAYTALCQAASSVVDRGLNVKTARSVRLEELGIDAPHRMRYEAGNWFDLRRVLRPGAVSRDDVFLELGCGKGRIVLMAARYPFRRVIGVELSARLTAIARHNLETCRLRFRCHDIELVNADVLEYDIPDAVTVVYLFNPFDGPILDTVLTRLIASVDRHPRSVRVIYRNPDEDRLLRTNRFVLDRVSPGLRPGRKWREDTSIRMYRVVPARGEESPAMVSAPPSSPTHSRE